MIKFESLGSLRIYQDVLNQNYYYNRCLNQTDVTYNCAAKMALPFMFRRLSEPNTINRLVLVHAQIDGTVLTTTILNTIDVERTTILVDGQNWDYFSFKPQAFQAASGFVFEPAPNNPLTDIYYYRIEMQGTGGIYYSERFTICDHDPVLYCNERIENGDFANGAVNWNLINGDVIISGGAISQPLIGQSGDMFEYSGTIDYSPFEQYLLCFSVTNLNQGAGATFRVITGNEIFVIPSTGDFCFLTSDPSQIKVFSQNSTWVMTNFSLRKIVSFGCLTGVHWYNDCNMDVIPFERFNYSNWLLLDADIVQPQYLNNLNEIEDGRLNKHTTFGRTDKQWYIHAINLIEPVLDALSTVPLYERVEIYAPEPERLFDKNAEVDTIDFSVIWDAPLCMSEATLTLTEPILIASKCCATIDEEECQECESWEDVSNIFGEITCNEEGIFIAFEIDTNYALGDKIRLSGFSPDCFNGTWTIIGGDGASLFYLDIEDCCFDLEDEGTTEHQIESVCMDTLNIRDGHQAGTVEIYGESYGLFVQLYSAPYIDGAQCDELTFTLVAGAGTLTREEYADTGFIVEYDGVSQICYKVVSFTPLLDCEYESSCDCLGVD